MSDKKGLSAFLNKNKKTKKPTTEQSQADQAKQAQDDHNQNDKDQKNTPINKDGSSDEEEDELDVASKALHYGNIKDKKDVADSKLADDKKHGFGFEDTKPQDKDSKQTKQKLPGDGIKFGARPTFGRKTAGGKFGGEDFGAGLNDLDDEGNVKPKEKQLKTYQAQEGQKDFVNLGSTAKSAKTEHPEEERKATGVKPTFRGKLNLAGTGAQQDEANAGVTKDYSFGVVYKSEHTHGDKDGKPREPREPRKEGEEHKGGFHKKPRDKGRAFGEHQDKEEDDFQVVKDGTRKPHKKKFNDDTSSDEEGKPRGGFRGGRGRGGFERGGLERRSEDGPKRSEGEAVRGARVERGGHRGNRGDFRN